MMKRRTAIATLVAFGISVPAAFAQTQGVHVVDSAPKAHAQIGSRSSEFFVRFDRPVDHIKSTLVIKQGDKVIERLHPRLESAPEVLFASAPTLPPGNYMLHWAVITVQGTKAIEGDIPFSVSDNPPK
jgi:methionine-rich copper-binding protein CopC